MSQGSKADNDDLNVEDLDPSFALEVADQPEGRGILRCFACGTCSAGCPVRKFNERFDPRKIIRMVLLGMREEVLKDPFIWLCATCYTCQERCPQGVRVSDIMCALKNLSIRHGNMPEGIPMQFKLLREKGCLYPLDEFDNKKRAKAGLPPLPADHPDVGELLMEIEELLGQNQ